MEEAKSEQETFREPGEFEKQVLEMNASLRPSSLGSRSRSPKPRVPVFPKHPEVPTGKVKAHPKHQ